MFFAEILAHSIGPDGQEAVTFKVRFPRIVLAELNTHRVFSKNTSSSRAIPINKMISHVFNNMFFPVWWGANQPGMQANNQLIGARLKLAKFAWRTFGVSACAAAWIMDKIGLHKQITNRLIENFSYVTMIITTTDIDNFLRLRNHDDAQPEIRKLAALMNECYSFSLPDQLDYGLWHLPLVTEAEKSELDIEDLRMISAARCASTSYLTVDGQAMTVERAKKLCDKLIGSDPIHASPFEHQLTPDRLIEVDVRLKGKRNFKPYKVWEKPELHGNTVGFIQHRKLIDNNCSTNQNHSTVGKLIF